MQGVALTGGLDPRLSGTGMGREEATPLEPGVQKPQVSEGALFERRLRTAYRRFQLKTVIFVIIHFTFESVNC